MNIRKLIFLNTIVIAMAFCNIARAIQVGNPTQPWSSHSYEQTAPAPVQAVKEDKPIIIHTPPLEIPSNKDLYLSAIIKNIGPGTPIIHYRFGDTKKYYTRLMHQGEPQLFAIKILSAALVDNKIDYYIEVSTGTKSLASMGTETDPLSIKIVTSGFPVWILALSIFAVVGILLIRPAIRWSGNKAEEKRKYEPIFKTPFESSAEKLSKLR